MKTGNGWKLIEVTERQWIQDTSGVYSVINHTPTNDIRLDLMNNVDQPLVTLVGKTSGAIYKGLADYCEAIKIELSLEHSMYVGRELARCELLKSEFVQD